VTFRGDIGADWRRSVSADGVRQGARGHDLRCGMRLSLEVGGRQGGGGISSRMYVISESILQISCK